MDVIKKIEELKLIPTVVIEETKNALPLVNQERIPYNTQNYLIIQ